MGESIGGRVRGELLGRGTAIVRTKFILNSADLGVKRDLNSVSTRFFLSLTFCHCATLITPDDVPITHTLST